MAERKKIDKRSLLTRTLSGIVIAFLLILFGILGGWFFYGFIFAVSLFGLFEFYRVFGIERRVIGYAGFLMGAVYWVLLGAGLEKFLFPALIAAFMVLSGVYVFDFSNTDSVGFNASFTGFVYVIVLMSFIYRVRVLEDGMYLVFLVFIASWGNDVFAYFVGSVFGRHPLSPVLSPKKSLEGLVGGLFGAAFLGAIYGAVFSEHFTALWAPSVSSAIICFFAGAVSVVGDLLASAFKRNHDIKDYSRLIPGHGGVLDRFDSCIFVAPVIYLLALLFM